MKLKATLLFVTITAAAMIGFYFIKQSKEKAKHAAQQQQQAVKEKAAKEKRKLNTDSHRIKGKITVGLDSYLGYYPLRSNRMSNKMLSAGYNMEFIDDAADYSERSKRLATGELDFAVFTVDSFILNNAPSFPGKIIMVISESKGADAIVSKKEIEKINDLTSISATLDSPSHHLIKASIIDFGLDELKEKIKPANGSEDALKQLRAGNIDAAVLWEPDVSKAIADPRFKTLFSTKNTSKLIVDILVASDKVVNEQPEKIDALLTNYFPTLKFYQSNRATTITEFMKDSKLTEQAASEIVDAIDWINLNRNASRWFGIQSPQNPVPRFEIVEAIRLTNDILIQYGDFQTSPLPYQGPLHLLSSRSISNIFKKQAAGQKIEGLDSHFSRLSIHQWNELTPVATLKIKPIKFRPGTNLLTSQTKEEILNIKNILSRYPRYRIRIEGHTSTQGNPELNKSLSKERAQAVKDDLIKNYQLNPNRILAVGEGAERPLNRGRDESYRAWLHRLPRVEFHLLEEIY